ncbi:MAG: threonylcarbamoyl-AMP synthase [Clostridiales bacterium]|nr:threonylcarbamoyl-AMP synthase [Clostridiales bacterium]
MNTIIRKVSNDDLTGLDSVIEEAAYILKAGGLVAFPTETVYGLGADSFNPKPVKKIYEVKGRPSDNPLIIHISERPQLGNLVSGISNEAEKLIENFWPGPLTLILKKASTVPFYVTGGLDTIAVRMPADNIARRLLSGSNIFIAAPSANSSGKPSPTRASHVEFDLGGKIDMIIDGGSCGIGVESTIVDLSTEVPCLLRPGGITLEMLRPVLGHIEVDKGIMGQPVKPKAPGMKYKHYSPDALVTIINGDIKNIVNGVNKQAEKCYSEGKKVGILATSQTQHSYDKNKYLVLIVGDRCDEAGIASNLFDSLRKFDFYNTDVVFAEGFSESGLGHAIMNRLKKASGYNIINV